MELDYWAVLVAAVEGNTPLPLPDETPTEVGEIGGA